MWMMNRISCGIEAMYMALTDAYQRPGRVKLTRYQRGRGYAVSPGVKQMKSVKTRRPVGSNGGQGGRKGDRR